MSIPFFFLLVQQLFVYKKIAFFFWLTYQLSLIVSLLCCRIFKNCFQLYQYFIDSLVYLFLCISISACWHLNGNTLLLYSLCQWFIIESLHNWTSSFLNGTGFPPWHPVCDNGWKKEKFKKTLEASHDQQGKTFCANLKAGWDRNFRFLEGWFYYIVDCAEYYWG